MLLRKLRNKGLFRPESIPVKNYFLEILGDSVPVLKAKLHLLPRKKFKNFYSGPKIPFLGLKNHLPKQTQVVPEVPNTGSFVSLKTNFLISNLFHD